MKFVVKNREVEIKKGVSRAGKPYEIFEQAAFLHTGDEVRKCVVNLRTGQSPYDPGDYALHPDSFTVDRFGGLQIGRVHLVRIPPNAKGA